MKKFRFFGVFILLSILICKPVSAMHDLHLDKVKQWIEKHSFLAAYTFQRYDNMSESLYLTAFRQLQDNYFVDVRFVFVDQKMYGLSLDVTKREYDPSKAKEQYYQNNLDIPDNRPWRILNYADIWERENPKAYLLLKEIFGEDTAEDFRNSKLVFHNYSLKLPSDYEGAELIKLEHLRNNIVLPGNKISLYLGNKYGYEPMHWDGARLKIYKIDDFITELKIHEENQKIYEFYLKEKAKENVRNQPAEISIED